MTSLYAAAKAFMALGILFSTLFVACEIVPTSRAFMQCVGAACIASLTIGLSLIYLHDKAYYEKITKEAQPPIV